MPRPRARPRQSRVRDEAAARARSASLVGTIRAARPEIVVVIRVENRAAYAGCA